MVLCFRNNVCVLCSSRIFCATLIFSIFHHHCGRWIVLIVCAERKAKDFPFILVVKHEMTLSASFCLASFSHIHGSGFLLYCKGNLGQSFLWKKYVLFNAKVFRKVPIRKPLVLFCIDIDIELGMTVRNKTFFYSFHWPI